MPPLAPWQVTALLMVLALANGYAALNYAQVRLLFAEHMIWRALTAVNLSVFLGVAFTQVASGFLVHGLTNHKATPEIAYRAVFAMMAGLLDIALLSYSRFRVPTAIPLREAASNPVTASDGHGWHGES